MEEWYKHHKLHDVLQTGSITTLDLPLVLSCRRDIVIGRFEFDLQPLAELDRGRRLNYRHCFVIQNGTFWTFYTFLHSEIPIWRCCLNQLQNWSVLKIWVATPTQSSARLPLFGHPWRPAFLKKSLMQDAMSANKPFLTIHFGSRRPSVRNNVSNKQASAFSFSKMRSQVGFTALRSWSCVLINGYCRSCFESSSGSCSFLKRFSIFPIHEMFVVAR